MSQTFNTIRVTYKYRGREKHVIIPIDRIHTETVTWWSRCGISPDTKLVVSGWLDDNGKPSTDRMSVGFQHKDESDIWRRDEEANDFSFEVID